MKKQLLISIFLTIFFNIYTEIKAIAAASDDFGDFDTDTDTEVEAAENAPAEGILRFHASFGASPMPVLAEEDKLTIILDLDKTLIHSGINDGIIFDYGSIHPFLMAQNLQIRADNRDYYLPAFISEFLLYFFENSHEVHFYSAGMSGRNLEAVKQILEKILGVGDFSAEIRVLSREHCSVNRNYFVTKNVSRFYKKNQDNGVTTINHNAILVDDNIYVIAQDEDKHLLRLPEGEFNHILDANPQMTTLDILPFYKLLYVVGMITEAKILSNKERSSITDALARLQNNGSKKTFEFKQQDISIYKLGYQILKAHAESKGRKMPYYLPSVEDSEFQTSKAAADRKQDLLNKRQRIN